MKNVWMFAVLSGLCAAPSAWASNPFEDFKSQASQTVLKPFAKDFGGLLGATDFNSAKVPKLGGFDVGVWGAVQNKPAEDNLALRNAGIDAFGLPLLRVEVGLPLGLSVFARGLSVNGASIVGGGLRYQIYKSGLVLAIPDIAVTAGYDTLSHDALDLGHFGASAQASWNIPILKPFVGVGYDSTSVEVKQSATPALVGLKATGTGSRMAVGASLTPFPFSYLFAAYQLLHGESGFSFGLGVRFGGVI